MSQALFDLPLWTVVPLATTALIAWFYGYEAGDDEFDPELASFAVFLWAVSTVPALVVAWLK